MTILNESEFDCNLDYFTFSVETTPSQVLQHHANGQETRQPWGQRNSGGTGPWQGTPPWKSREANPTTTPGRAHNLVSIDDRTRAETSGNAEGQRARGEGLGVTHLNGGSESTCSGSGVSKGYGESLAGDAREMAAREHCFWSAGRNESPVPRDQSCCLDGNMDVVGTF